MELQQLLAELKQADADNDLWRWETVEREIIDYCISHGFDWETELFGAQHV